MRCVDKTDVQASLRSSDSLHDPIQRSGRWGRGF